VFIGAQIIPGDVAHQILGPTADARAIASLNAKLGLDQPAIARYLSFVGGFLRGDLGTSYTLRTPIGPTLLNAVFQSLKLAGIAFIIVVPLGIVGGVFSAMHEGKAGDRIITIVGLSAMVIPEFVSGIVLLLIFGVWLRILPVSASAPPGSSLFTQLRYLILPAIPLVFVLFGYIARVTRAGTIEALNSDYVRTAVLKGLPWRTVIRRHILRNALPPTVTVVATQVGYLFGGLVVIEILFNYHGIGLLIFTATQAKDFPLLEDCVLVIGALYLGATLLADIIYSFLNPRIRIRSST
jgi:peptide/nickel transport system permease protein